MNNFFKKALPYIISSVTGILIFVLIICVNKIWDQSNTKSVMQVLSDAAFVPGVILAGFGLIVFASNGGVFDMLSYGFIRFFDLFKKDCRNNKYKDYYEYSQSKKDRKRGMAFLLIVGLAFIMLSVVFFIVYYNL